LLEENENILDLKVKIFKDESILIKLLEINILDYMKDRIVENVSNLGEESEIEIKYIFKDHKKITDSEYLEFDSRFISRKVALDKIENINKKTNSSNSEKLNNSSENPKAKYHKIMNNISSPLLLDKQEINISEHKTVNGSEK
jgi:hypothetical protein